MTYKNYGLLFILDGLLTLGRLKKKSTKGQGSGYGFVVIKLPPVT